LRAIACRVTEAARLELKDATTKVDGDLAKRLRNAFGVDHCRAIWLALADTLDIARLEAGVLAMGPEHAIAWNRRRMQIYEEPADLIDATLRRLGSGALDWPPSNGSQRPSRRRV
jgi:DNA polymerase III subunit epsilon